MRKSNHMILGASTKLSRDRSNNYTGIVEGPGSGAVTRFQRRSLTISASGWGPGQVGRLGSAALHVLPGGKPPTCLLHAKMCFQAAASLRSPCPISAARQRLRTTTGKEQALREEQHPQENRGECDGKNGSNAICAGPLVVSARRRRRRSMARRSAGD